MESTEILKISFSFNDLLESYWVPDSHPLNSILDQYKIDLARSN